MLIIKQNRKWKVKVLIMLNSIFQELLWVIDRNWKNKKLMEFKQLMASGKISITNIKINI